MPLVTALVRTGKFWHRFGPPSGSRSVAVQVPEASFAVTPSPPLVVPALSRSMPRPLEAVPTPSQSTLPKIEFCVISTEPEMRTTTPGPLLPAMTLRSTALPVPTCSKPTPKVSLKVVSQALLVMVLLTTTLLFPLCQKWIPAPPLSVMRLPRTVVLSTRSSIEIPSGPPAPCTSLRRNSLSSISQPSEFVRSASPERPLKAK